MTRDEEASKLEQTSPPLDLLRMSNDREDEYERVRGSNKDHNRRIMQQYTLDATINKGYWTLITISIETRGMKSVELLRSATI